MLFGTVLARRASRDAHARRAFVRSTRRAPRPRRMLLEALEDRCLLNLGDVLYTLTDPSPQTGVGFGAVAADGNLTVLGEPDANVGGLDRVGRAYVFNSSTGALVATLENPTPAGYDTFGASVAVSGSIVLVGAPYDDAGAELAGSVYIFDGPTGNLLRTLDNPTPQYSDKFGWSVAASGNIVVVGAPHDRTGAGSAGSAYIFDAASGNLLRTLNNPTPAISEWFGLSVAVSGSTVVVGVPNQRDPAGSWVGGAYVFDATTGNLLQTLNSPSPASGQFFGSSVAICGTVAVVGAPHDYTAVSTAGRAYVFDATAGNLLWTLNSPTPVLSGQFGYSIAVSENTVIVAELGANTGANEAGSAYLFDAASGNLLWMLSNPTPADYDRFGISVALYGSRAVVVGGYQDDIAQAGGAAYVFDLTMTTPPVAAALDGTPGDDAFALSTDGTNLYVSVTLSGQPADNYTYSASGPLMLMFNALAGNDKITIDGGPNSESVTVQSTTVTFAGPPGTYQVFGNGIEDVRVTAGGGTGQRAALYDGPLVGGDDTFSAYPTYSVLTGTGYYTRVEGFSRVTAYETWRWVFDTAKFYDSPGADTFTASGDSPHVASMSGLGYHVEARGFRNNLAYSTAGGTDEAHLHDSPRNDAFTVKPYANHAYMSGPDFYDYASGFDEYYGYSTAGGTDKSYLYDSKGDDLYQAWANGDSWMHTPTIDAFSYGFAFNYGLSTAGGVDEAVLYGSDGNDSMCFQPGYTSGTLVVPRAYMTRPGQYFIYAQNFKKITGYAGNGGNDQVAFFDTAGNDTFTASPTEARMEGPPGSNILCTAMGDPANTAYRWETVRAYSQVGGYDKAYLTGSTGDDTFAAVGKPRTTYAGLGRLSGSGYFLEVYQFEEVYANLLTGNDTANLYDGTANDYFWAKLGAAVMTDGTLNDTTGDLLTPNTYYYKVYGFDSAASDRVNLWGNSGGTNYKKVINPLDYVLAVSGPWIDL